MRWHLLVFTLVSAACRRAPAPPAVSGDPQAARFVLEDHCGTCHRPDQSTAMPEALAIFDLSEEDFAGGMTEAQLASVLHRVENLAAPGGDLDPETFGGPATLDEVRIVQAFVDGELARRHGPIVCASSTDGLAGSR